MCKCLYHNVYIITADLSVSNADVLCVPLRYLHSPPGTKNFIRLCLTHVIFCSTQKRGNRSSFSLVSVLSLSVTYSQIIPAPCHMLVFVFLFYSYAIVSTSRCLISMWRRERRRRERRKRTSWCRPKTSSGGWWRRRSSQLGKGTGQFNHW